ncbi:MAG: tetratricopeptide repeat protein [Candidatus Eisenbacteria bacterium]
MTILGLALALASPSPAEDPPAAPSAGALFEQVLADEGLDAALARLREVIADTARAYTIEPFELLRAIPTRLVLKHMRTEALELLKLQTDLFADSQPYWSELGTAHLRCGNKDEAHAAFTKALEMSPDRKDIAWTLAHLDQLLATARLQVEREDVLIPGASTGLQGSCLGQTPPGRTPVVFAPGIVSTTAHEYHISFAPDGREIYFSRGGAGTFVSRWREDGWTVPEIVYFIDADHLTEEANVLPDGSGIVFCGRQELRSERELYRAARAGSGWGAPVKLFPGMYATATLDGTLYYTDRGVGRDYGAIVKRRWTGEVYGESEVVAGEGINSDFPDAHPFVAPDESLLLFDSYREPGAGIYASFGRDGSWGKAVLLNEILEIPPAGQCALSPDGRYLFFCMAGDLYWVDAGFLNELRDE